MILFLDFDGVLYLHGPDDPLFCYLPWLEALLREFPEVRVVISSSWREAHPFDEMKEYFSEDLRDRVIGFTPVEEPSRYGHTLLTRETEIQRWLFANGGFDQPWVALDDAEKEFHQHRDRLVICWPFRGFDEEAEVLLHRHFENGRIP